MCTKYIVVNCPSCGCCDVVQGFWVLCCMWEWMWLLWLCCMSLVHCDTILEPNLVCFLLKPSVLRLNPSACSTDCQPVFPPQILIELPEVICGFCQASSHCSCLAHQNTFGPASHCIPVWLAQHISLTFTLFSVIHSIQPQLSKCYTCSLVLCMNVHLIC